MTKSVDEILKQYSGADAVRERPSHPKGFEPGIVFDPTTQEPREATLASPVKINGIEDHVQYIRDKTGLEIPDGMKLVIDRLSLYGGEDETTSRWWYKYKFVPLEESGSLITGAEVASMMKAIRTPNRRKPTPLYDGEASMNISFADWQAGKAQGGGTQGFLNRFYSVRDQYVDRARELKKLNRNPGQLNIFGMGDLLEGCFVYPNQSFEIDLDRRGQIRIVVACIIEFIEAMAPYFSRVNVLAVPGNHGEHRVGGKKVNYSDNDDVAVFEHAAIAMANNPRYAHVNFIVAYDEVAKTMDVNGWIIGITHGQVFASGSSPEIKALNWVKGMALGRHPIGDADLLWTAHYHHLAMAEWGHMLWLQTPAMDGGSKQFTDFSGKFSAPGMQSFITTPENKFNDMFIATPK